jgi:MFS family permease
LQQRKRSKHEGTIASFAVAIFIEGLGGIYAGRVADRLGIRRVVFSYGILIAVACISMSFIQNLGQFYLFAAIFAFGFACASVVMPSLVADIFGLRSHGFLLGVTNLICLCRLCHGAGFKWTPLRCKWKL